MLVLDSLEWAPSQIWEMRDSYIYQPLIDQVYQQPLKVFPSHNEQLSNDGWSDSCKAGKWEKWK